MSTSSPPSPASPFAPTGFRQITIVLAIPEPFLGQVRARLDSRHRVLDVAAAQSLPPGDPPPGDLVVVLSPLAPRGANRAAVTRLIERAGWVHFLSTGVDGFPLVLLSGRTVTCGRGANSAAVAEFAVGLLLAAAKHFPSVWGTETDSSLAAAPLGCLAGSTVGLIGLGTIGREVARRLGGFDTRLLALRRHARPADLPGVSVVATLPELLAEAYHVIVAAPLTPVTDRLLDDAAFAAAKPGVHIVNIARGRIIDTDALVRAFDAGIVGRASLDVTDPEPLPADHPLRRNPRVVISPHVSWSAPGGTDRGIGMFADNLRRWQAGLPPDGVVDLAAGY
jgi:phosphoglycerate dehydrogenase-like enzyme